MGCQQDPAAEDKPDQTDQRNQQSLPEGPPAKELRVGHTKDQEDKATDEEGGETDKTEETKLLARLKDFLRCAKAIGGCRAQDIERHLFLRKNLAHVGSLQGTEGPTLAQSRAAWGDAAKRC